MANMSLVKVPMPEQDPQVRARNFKEVALGYTPEMAIEEANRCLGCKNPKCVEGCPVNVRIPEFIKTGSESVDFMYKIGFFLFQLFKGRDYLIDKCVNIFGSVAAAESSFSEADILDFINSKHVLNSLSVVNN